MLVTRTGSVDETRSLAAAVASCSTPGDVVLLAGDLGAGKTVFAQGFGQALGVTEAITSPTFALVRHYECSGGPIRTLLHADVYRLDHIREIVDLGLGELVEDEGVAVVEWGDVAEPVLGNGSLAIRIDTAWTDTAWSETIGTDTAGVDEDERSLVLRSIGDRWSDRWADLAAAVRPWVVTQ